MNRVFPLIFICFYLAGCNDKNSSELDVDSELRLEVSISHSVSDGDFVTDHRSSTLEIQLFEDQYEKLKLLKANQHIAVKNKGEFLLDIDGVRYDLSDYYYSNSNLISNGEGEYQIDLVDHQENIQQLIFSFTFDGGTFTSEIDVPSGVVVNNITHELDNFQPLADDVFIEWQHITLPAFIDLSQIVFIDSQEMGCVSEHIKHDILDTEASYVTSPSSFTFSCYDGTQTVERVKSNLNIVQNKADVASDFYGFQDVSVTYAQTYFWSSEDEL